MRWNPSRTVRRKPGKGGVRAGKRKEQQKGGIRVVFVRHMMRDGNSGGKMQMLVGEYCHPASWKSPETNHRFKTSIQKYFPYPKITVECSKKKSKNLPLTNCRLPIEVSVHRPALRPGISALFRKSKHIHISLHSPIIPILEYYCGFINRCVEINKHQPRIRDL